MYVKSLRKFNPVFLIFYIKFSFSSRLLTYTQTLLRPTNQNHRNVLILYCVWSDFSNYSYCKGVFSAKKFSSNKSGQFKPVNKLNDF
ncbi:hypothetical protein BpHYR1_030330 [Brachionus plicatilis]|uniref:Uncharacterized protein n=1 Tax=Brachionus plicatilis TaxID=10195 RepID=A0A3M7RRU6_BRAPC|nr:hypothetical protein BpHYR1_030330 [Brachionus plicatilis]